MDDFDIDFDFDLGDVDFDVDFDFGEGEGKSTEYSAVRSGVVDLVESATGWGTEADALYRRLSGEADSFDEAHRLAMMDLEYYEADNEYANYLSSGLGYAAGFLIPGAALSKVGTVAKNADKAGAIWKAVGLGAAEGVAYGAGHGHTLEERATSAAIGAGIGGGVSRVLGGKLIKSEEELTAAAKKLARQEGKGTHFGGEEGFKDVAAAKSSRAVGQSKARGERGVVGIDDSAEDITQLDDAPNQLFTMGRGMRNWMDETISPRFGRLAEDAETMARRGRHELDVAMKDDAGMVAAKAAFESSDELKNILVRINPELKDGSRLHWDSAIKLAKKPEEKEALGTLRTYVTKLQSQDPRNLHVVDGKVKAKINDFFPTEALEKIATKGNKGRTEHYNDPFEALREYSYDLSDAAEMARRFDVDTADVIKFSQMESNSLVESVIKATLKKAKRDTPDINKETLQNMEIGLRSQFIAARQGGNSMGSVMRRLTSTALLANPLNAVLNMVEGITAPIYQNGFEAWAETVPNAIVSTFSKRLGGKSSKWLTDASTGHGGQYMGELANTSKNTFTKAKDEFKAFGLIPESRQFSAGVDKVGEVMYNVSGVNTVNRMGREMLGNSAVKRGMKLASGDRKARAKLLEHDGMRGLTKSEKYKTMAALRKMKSEGKEALSPDDMGWVQNFYGASLNKWQPVSAASMPKAFHDNPNGRMFYSMLSYMNRQMNNINDDIGANMAKAVDAGLNTKEGQKFMRKAYSNGAKYTGLFGVLAGTWNTARLGLDPSKDKPFSEVFTVEGMAEATINDLASNMTMGLLNIRANQFGKKPLSVESIIPAPIKAAGELASGVASLPFELQDGEGFQDLNLTKAAQNYIPGVANADRFYRMGTGSRMLTGEGTGVGYLNDPLEAVGIKSKPRSLFDDLGL